MTTCLSPQSYVNIDKNNNVSYHRVLPSGHNAGQCIHILLTELIPSLKLAEIMTLLSFPTVIASTLQE